MKTKRLPPNRVIEDSLKKKGYNLIAGVDEAGRGPLAGPVIASAVLLKDGASFENKIADSKLLSARQRDKAFSEILSQAYVGIGIASEALIDEINIFNATCLAMERAIAFLMRRKFKSIGFLIDGRVKLNLGYYYEAIPRADSFSLSVACASIIAKVTRDRIMARIDKVVPQYAFSKHKGYGTKLHFDKLKEFGPSQFHRKSFYPVSEFFKK